MRGTGPFWQFIAATIVAGSYAFTSPLSAQCHCSTPQQEHNMRGYSFATSSCVRRHDDQYFVYETCVQNLGYRDLEFRWYIPGPHGWIPSGETSIGTRLRRMENNLHRQNGCLRYGNVQRHHAAEFQPHANDGTALKREHDIGCASVHEEAGLARLASQASREPQNGERTQLSGLLLSVFAPTDRERVGATMVQIAATVGFVSQDGILTHSLALRVSPYGDEFHPERIRLVPELQPLQAAYRAAYPNIVGDAGLPVGREEKTFVLEFETQEGPTLRDVRFDVIAGGSDRVASLLVPFWGSW